MKFCCNGHDENILLSMLPGLFYAKKYFSNCLIITGELGNVEIAQQLGKELQGLWIDDSITDSVIDGSNWFSVHNIWRNVAV